MDLIAFMLPVGLCVYAAIKHKDNRDDNDKNYNDNSYTIDDNS